ncbi:MAG: hypothetical protein CVT69_02240, partial [Actinobacteria bacterium HGW-Actinobacteria-9]
TKMTTSTLVPVGSEIAYEIVVTNAGPSTADDVTVSDTLPLDTNFVSASTGCAPVAGILECNLGSLAAGESTTIVVVLIPTAESMLVNTASVDTSTSEPIKTNNETPPVVTLAYQPVTLLVNKTAAPDPVLMGATLTYTITVTNDSIVTATDVTVSDALPAEVSYVSSSTSCSESLGIVMCNLGDLAPGASTAVTIDVTPNTTGTITNTVNVTTTHPGSTQQVFTDSASAASVFPDLIYAGSEVLGDGAITANDCNPLVVSVENIGGTSATVVAAVLSTVTPGVTVEQDSSGYPDIGAGSTELNNFAFRLSTAPDFECGSDIELVLTVTTAEGVFELPFTVATGDTGAAYRFDSNEQIALLDNTTTDSPVMVAGVNGPLAGVRVLMHATHTFVSDLRVELVAPDGTAVLLVNKQGTNGDNFGTACSPDDQRTIFDDTAATSITASVAPFVGSFIPETPLAVLYGTSGAAVNGEWKLRITDDQSLDPGELVCWSLELVTEPCSPGVGQCGTDLMVTKLAREDRVANGQPLTYDIVITNNGPDDASDVQVVDTLPAGSTFVNASTGCTESAGVLDCFIGQLAAYETTTVTLTLIPNTTGSLTNVVSVIPPDENDPLTDDNISSVT